MGLNLSTVLITGASSGIGAACAKAFAEHGANLILCARTAAKLESLAESLRSEQGVQVHVAALDLQYSKNVEQVVASLPEAFRAIDVLVNNAGLALGLDKVHDGKFEHWDQVIDTNVKGLLYVTREVLRIMLDRQQGHVINIGSTSGYSVYPGGAVYCATKFAVRALSEGFKMDVHGTPIRISEVNPGMVETNFSVTRFEGDEARAKNVYADMTALTPEDVADAVLYCATRPAHVDIRSLQIMPTDQTAAHMLNRSKN